VTGWVARIGVPCGIVSLPAPTPDRSGMIRRGDRLILIKSDCYRVWRAAGTAPQAARLKSWAARQGIGAPEEIVSDLMAESLLLAGGGDLRSRVGGLAVAFLGEGLGAARAGRARFAVSGRRGAVGVSAVLYDFLIRTDGSRACGDLCRALDANRDGQGLATLDILADALPALVRAGVVRLDAAVSR